MIGKISLFGVLLVSYMYSDVRLGKEVYLINCASCHSIKMQGGLGKDFNLVSYTRTKDEIRKYALNPSKYYKEFGYSANAMPTLPLSGKELDDIADFIDSLQPFKKWMIKNKTKEKK
jgi:mono/diheme cytochrome c family protein